MNINWKLRFQNKVTLSAILLGVVALAYQIIGMMGIAPEITQNEIGQVITMVIDLLVMLGVVVDPTTAGIGDNDRVMSYKFPVKE